MIGLVWQRIRRRRAEEEAQTLSGRLITAHEDERRWLARELHDDITQRLAGLAIDAAKLPGGDLSPSDIDARRSIRERLVQLSEDVHDLSYRLHPSVLDDLGLVEALKAECERVARSESVRVDVEADKLPPSLPKRGGALYLSCRSGGFAQYWSSCQSKYRATIARVERWWSAACSQRQWQRI